MKTLLYTDYTECDDFYDGGTRQKGTLVVRNFSTFSSRQGRIILHRNKTKKTKNAYNRDTKKARERESNPNTLKTKKNKKSLFA